MLNQKNKRDTGFAINASLGQYTDTETVNSLVTNATTVNQPSYVVHEFGTQIEYGTDSDMGGVLNLGTPTYIESSTTSDGGGSIKTFKGTLIANDTELNFGYDSDLGTINMWCIGETPLNSEYDDGSTYCSTIIHNYTQGTGYAYVIPNATYDIDNTSYVDMASGAILEGGTAVESVCTGIIGVTSPLNYINMLGMNEEVINDGIITEGERYVKIHAHSYMHVCPTIRIASGTKVENHVDWFIPVVKCLIIWSDPTSVVDMWATDAIDFGTIRIRAKASMLSAQMIRHWSSLDVEPTVEFMSDCVINPVIHKHSTWIVARPEMYSAAEVISRWVYMENHVHAQADGLIKKFVYSDMASVSSWYAFAEVIQRWVYMHVYSEMDGGQGIRVMNPTPRIEVSVQQHATGNIKGKMATKVEQSAQVKGSAVLYVDGGVKVSEHKDCPVFI